MRVEEIMTRRVETIAPNLPVAAAIEKMRQKRIRHLVVMEGGRIAGVVSDSDMRSLDPASSPIVENVMTAPVVSASPDTTVRRAANLLRGRSIGCLPVVEDGELVGIVTTTDLLERIGRGAERPVSRSKRWILKSRGPRRKSVVGRRNFSRNVGVQTGAS